MKTFTIEAPCGALTGRQDRNRVTVFNIPYATGEPFGAPKPVEKLEHQGFHREPPATEQVLTITAPSGTDESCEKTASANTARCTATAGTPVAPMYPILIWIHGGGYEHGHPSEPWCDAKHFAEAGIVTISLGYRKRFEGFWQDRSERATDIARPPRAIDDLVAAVDWVHRNAPTFGGDTSNITVTGQSAGAALALALASDPRTSGRLHRMIAMSPAFSVLHGSAFRRRIVARSLGYRGNATVQDMADATPEQLEKTWTRLRRLLPIDPAVGVTAHSFTPTIPTIVTATSEEFFFVPILEKLDRSPLKRLMGRGIARTFRGKGPFPGEDTEHYGDRPCASAVSDSAIRSNAVTVAERCLEAGIPIWTVQFRPGMGLGTGPDGKPTNGAPHCVELPRFFGREHHHPFHHIVVDFARTGNTTLPPYENSRLTTEFSGADELATQTIATDVWAAPRQLFGMRN